jgi:hypothetical protein
MENIRTVFDQAHGIHRNRTVHVIPIADELTHTSDADCWCKPFKDGDSIYVHNSKDGREKGEKIHNKKCSQGWQVVDIYEPD